ncbi:HAMP domain-containing histidine kinase [Campylobacter sp. RM9344]|uniref:histidine kinase n=1 Tax=Campylobacter californiensis TaxID=1032243 RepID=A0AAW3ZV86_9BACT|nr:MULTISPECIES: HAMP domain-containing sensor histidine kinase [unclassified Campylobacter]MBE2985267.1 HAMP domain-containing histidine kinase [Campylobacter sp. RM6883]MBE2986366.1 HAMP domain-containing histidine kinase [Campylobacter sp. RM12919]MBE2988003.1 HAMP domain-containing histidine kinase [Campylobacter sp. RM12920]MBE2995922.1 HAMP domain-containing histidine kinase [Campylobacter sp. RM6913]MBE3022376.1 HAMP domain-containing histidine kinase [Campylobacter sp. 7477a]MBE303002
MDKSFKIPILATIVIMALFVFQSLVILGLSQKDETSKNLFSLLKYEKQIRTLFLNNKEMPTSLIFKYAIYDADFNPIVSTLSVRPENFKFVVLEQGKFLFYKSFFFKDKKLYYIIVTQEQSNKRMVFLTALMLTVALVMVFFILYMSYLGSVKPYKDVQRYMSNFFNDAMHELKTPLGVAGMNLEMLGMDNKYTNRIKNALKQMQITYEDVEFYIKRGYIKFPKERIDLGLYIHERILFLNSVAQSKHIMLVPNLEEKIFVNISKLAAQRIIDNTITNAIKYSPQDSRVIINLRSNGEEAVLSVQDFGDGIKDTKRIWKRYVREDEVRGGFGLGLNIVSEICNKEDIKYEVKSVPKEGSTFYYYFQISD